MTERADHDPVIAGARTPLDAEILPRLRGTPRLVMLDIDGTIAPIAARPEAAIVPPHTRRLVSELASKRGVVVALVTGRAASDAQRMVGAQNVWVIGNHGLELMSPAGDVDVTPQVSSFAAAVGAVARTLERSLRHIPGIIIEDKHWSLSVHFRLADPAIVPFIRAGVEAIGRDAGMRVNEGKKVLEVRPPVLIDKGTAVLALARRTGGFEARASLIYIGDDETDEDAFRALRVRLPAAVTVRVAESDGASAAQFRIASPADVRDLLSAILALPP